MPRRGEQDEIDFLMETRHGLQAELDRIDIRLSLLLGGEALRSTVKLATPERRLSVVPDPPEGA